MGESYIQLPADSTGKKLRTTDKGTPGHDQYVIPTDERLVSFRGRAATFATLGRAGTTGQKIFALHNASGSGVLVQVNRIWYDVMQTAARVVEPTKVRVHRFTAVPTNGNSVPKVALDSAQSSNGSVTAWQDSSADNTGSGTTLTVTIPASSLLVEEWAARALTLVGYEQFDRPVVLEDSPVVLRAGEGVVVFLDYTAAAANPVTDKWLAGAEWEEYTLP